ncbi:MAG: sulfatase-like hydrolase/transferase [Isosphaeraceae bacterium]
MRPFSLIRWAGLALLLANTAASADTERPNVIIFLSDDVGWAEYGFQGGKDVPTPHIDAIAAQGVKFTQGYVSGPYCSPTRAGLLTGRYQTRYGHEFNGSAGPRGPGLPSTETTLATRLKARGYATCAVGKWHLGFTPGSRPTARGFDEFYGTLANTPFFHPTNFVDSRVSNETMPVADDDFYTTDAYADRAVEWLKSRKDGPWFLYVPFNAQHAPLQATKKYLDRFPGITDEKRKIFAAMMSAMDDAVGRVMATVRELGQEDRTIVAFLSDNGGPTAQTTSSNLPLRGFKATTWEGGVRVPFCMQWKGKIPPGTVYEHPVIQLDLVPTVLAAAGAPVDPAWKLDGVDLLPYLTGAKSGRPHETLYWRFGQQWAIRHGDLKLVVARQGGGMPELYDLASDVSEAENLALKRPEAVRELQGLWDAWNAQQAPASVPDQPAGTPKKKAAAKKKGTPRKAAGPSAPSLP